MMLHYKRNAVLWYLGEVKEAPLSASEQTYKGNRATSFCTLKKVVLFPVERNLRHYHHGKEKRLKANTFFFAETTTTTSTTLWGCLKDLKSKENFSSSTAIVVKLNFFLALLCRRASKSSSCRCWVSQKLLF